MEINGEQLEVLLPHRPPIVMLDKVVDVERGLSGTGIRHFRTRDSFFEGHFPSQPILPGVFVIEAFAQTAMAVSLAEFAGDQSVGKLGLLAKVNEMTFTEKIVPGLTVEFSIKIDRHVGTFSFVSCKAAGGGKEFASGILTLKIAS